LIKRLCTNAFIVKLINLLFVSIMIDMKVKLRDTVAYILINIETGKEYEIVDRIKKIEGVTEALITYGMWDIVVRVEVYSLPYLDKIVSTIRQIDGVRQTTTLISI